MSHDRKYLDWLRSQPCAVTGAEYPEDGREPAHVFKSIHGGGMARKSLRALPLSNAEHARQSGMPEIKYWQEAVQRNPVLLKQMVGLLAEWYERVYLTEQKNGGTFKG